MGFSIVPLRPFERQLERLVKKFPSLRDEIAALTGSLGSNPFQGKPLGRSAYKIRIAIASKGKGKSGGGRVVTFVQVTSTRVYLLTIFDKSERDTLSDKELKSLIDLIP